MLIGLLREHALWLLVRRLNRSVIDFFAIRVGLQAWKRDACATSAGMLMDDDS
jgi:hypothetical protein